MFHLLFICIGVICTNGTNIPTDMNYFRGVCLFSFYEILLYSNPWTDAKNVVFVWNWTFSQVEKF